MTRREPLDPDLYATVVDEAKAHFQVWPSAYASGWVVKTYKERGGKYAGEAQGEDTGLTKWFGEEWVDLSRPIYDESGTLVGYEPCGRKQSTPQFSTKDYPKCRPLAEAMQMTPEQVADAIRRKRRAESQVEPEQGRAPVRVPTYREDDPMRRRRNPTELLLLNPGSPTANTRSNPILLRSDEEALRYGTMVADAYLAAPAFDESQVWRWKLLIDHVERLFERIQRGKQGVKVVFVEGQPYADERELQKGVAETGILYVSTDFNTHPVFTPEQNLKFRAVHDYMTHIARDVTFGLRGEIAAYNTHAKMVPPDAIPALFTEVVAQASTFITKGFFPEQKIAVLPFDPYNVGIELDSSRRRRNPAATRDLTMPEVAQVIRDLNVPDAWRTRFMQGLAVEWQEHGGGIDAHSAGVLVIDHLNEDPNYYRHAARAARQNPHAAPPFVKKNLDNMLDRTGKTEDILTSLADIYAERAQTPQYADSVEQMHQTEHALRSAAQTVEDVWTEEHARAARHNPRRNGFFDFFRSTPKEAPRYKRGSNGYYQKNVKMLAEGEKTIVLDGEPVVVIHEHAVFDEPDSAGTPKYLTDHLTTLVPYRGRWFYASTKRSTHIPNGNVTYVSSVFEADDQGKPNFSLELIEHKKKNADIIVEHDSLVQDIPVRIKEHEEHDRRMEQEDRQRAERQAARKARIAALPARVVDPYSSEETGIKASPRSKAAREVALENQFKWLAKAARKYAQMGEEPPSMTLKEHAESVVNDAAAELDPSSYAEWCLDLGVAAGYTPLEYCYEEAEQLAEGAIAPLDDGLYLTNLAVMGLEKLWLDDEPRQNPRRRAPRSRG